MMFEGHDLATLSDRAMKPLRKEIQMIFQDPYSSLNPRHTVGTIVGTPLRVHNVVPEKQVLDRVRELLQVVGLNPEHYNRYPNEFSGGQRQRIGIARALALQPKLLVADEPVSALDVSIQAQVVNLLQDVQAEFNIAFLFIAHDLAVVRHFCPEIAVMYLGKIVEIGDRESVYEHAHHPYTQALLSASPDVKQAAIGGRRERIRLEGDVPSPINPPSGCRFRTRCWLAQDICAKQEPPLLQIGKTPQGGLPLRRRARPEPRQAGDRAAAGHRRPGQPRPGRQPGRAAQRAGLRRHLVRPARTRPSGRPDLSTGDVHGVLLTSDVDELFDASGLGGRAAAGRRLAGGQHARLGAAGGADAAAHARRARRPGAAAGCRARRCAS